MTDAHPDTLATPNGFRAFYDEALPVVYGYFVRRTESVEAAKDLTQETFMAAVRALRRGKRIEAPLPWIVAVARRRLVDHYRRGSRRRGAEARLRQVAPRGDATGPTTTATEARLITALQRVPAAHRAALVLRYVDDLPVKEVAGLLGKSERATESLLVRARGALLAAWEEISDD